MTRFPFSVCIGYLLMFKGIRIAATGRRIPHPLLRRTKTQRLGHPGGLIQSRGGRPPLRLRRRERTALLSAAAEDSVLAKQLSDEGTEDFRQGRADWPRLGESRLHERLPTNRKASASASQTTGSYPRACARGCPSPCALPATYLQQARRTR